MYRALCIYLCMHDKADGCEQCACKNMYIFTHSLTHAITGNHVCKCFMTDKHFGNELISAGKIENSSISFANMSFKRRRELITITA